MEFLKQIDFELALTSLTLQEPEFSLTVPENYKTKGGVYVLRCGDQSIENPSVIPRCLGNDNSGILYIGQGMKFPHRVGDLARTIDSSYKQNLHGAGVRYNSDSKFREVFPIQNLYISFFITDNPVELESTLISEYVEQFGEVPPLNGQG